MSCGIPLNRIPEALSRALDDAGEAAQASSALLAAAGEHPELAQLANRLNELAWGLLHQLDQIVGD